MSIGNDDASNTIIATARKVAMVAAAGYELYRAYDIAKREWDIAKKYYRISQNWLDYYRDYFAPVEDQELRETMALTVEKPNYDTAQGRARVAAMIAYRGKLFDVYKNTTRYTTGRRAYVLSTLMTAQANAIAQADSLGYRNERAYIKLRNDQRFKKMLNTAKRGRNMATEPVSFAKDALGSYGNLWNQIWNTVKTIGKTAGYADNRRPTEYPVTTMSASIGTSQSPAAGTPYEIPQYESPVKFEYIPDAPSTKE